MSQRPARALRRSAGIGSASCWRRPRRTGCRRDAGATGCGAATDVPRFARNDAARGLFHCTAPRRTSRGPLAMPWPAASACAPKLLPRSVRRRADHGHAGPRAGNAETWGILRNSVGVTMEEAHMRSLEIIAILAVLASAAAAQRPRVGPVVPLKAESFDLSEVRLLEGPFKHAMDLDVRYLKSLPPDRLLHSFRITAGLSSSAQPLGGWEEPNSEVRGHFVGHYLTACAMAYRVTGDASVKANADTVVAGMAECQARFASGYLSAFPETFFDRLEALQPVWVPWYTLHKVYQGLLDMHTLAGNAQAMTVLTKAAGWAVAP
ncbi:MAG: hypothetical protein FJX72_00490, partial [Armatimonadetes bacterium]|nr:hypothetical protein [Armatimonadota bacterium]